MPTPNLAILIKMSGGPLPPNTRAGDVEIYDNGRLVIYETDTDIVERQVDRQEILNILQFARQVGFFQLPSVIHDGGTVTNIPDVTISMTDAMGSATVTVTNYQRLKGEMRRDPFDQVYKKVTDLAWQSYTSGKPYVPADNAPAEPVGKGFPGGFQAGKPPVDLPSLDDLLKTSNFDFESSLQNTDTVAPPPLQSQPTQSPTQNGLPQTPLTQNISQTQVQSPSLPPLPNLSQSQSIPPSPIPPLSPQPSPKQSVSQPPPVKPTVPQQQQQMQQSKPSQQQPLPPNRGQGQQPPPQQPPHVAQQPASMKSSSSVAPPAAGSPPPKNQTPKAVNLPESVAPQTQSAPKKQTGNPPSKPTNPSMPPSSPQHAAALASEQTSVSSSASSEKSSERLSAQPVPPQDTSSQPQAATQVNARTSTGDNLSQSSSQVVQTLSIQQGQKSVQKERTQALVMKRPAVGWDHTQEILARLEETLKSKVLVMYVADGHTLSMNDTRFLYTHLRKGGYKKSLHVVPVIPSGHLPVVWRMATLLREFGHEITVILPDAASVFSTMLAISADVILMNPLGYLSPLETPFTHPLLPSSPVPLSEVLQFAHFLTADSTAHRDSAQLHSLHPLVITAAQRQLAFIRLLCSNLLSLPHKKEDQPVRDIPVIVDHLTSSYLSPDYPITLQEAKQLGLPVSETTEEMNDLLWELIRHYRYLTYPVIAIRDGYRSLEQQACIFESVGRRTLYYIESHEDQRKNVVLDTHNRWREVTMQISVSQTGKEHSNLVWKELQLVDSAES